MGDVVRCHNLGNGILVVVMEDRASRNTFSHDLIRGLMETFEQIRQEASARVVVIHGYENYFCCGGTQEELLGILEGKITFSDVSFFRLLLDCEVPVIAAMQGHALGGGLAFGCFADLIVMAEEAIYSANFMKYGFTPGMGATLIVPRKLGTILGAEMLFSARNYYGSELKARGVSARVVSKQDVIAEAIALARDLAEKPRASLLLVKQHLAQPVRDQLPAVIEQELAMHRVSFRLPGVRERIETLFRD